MASTTRTWTTSSQSIRTETTTSNVHTSHLPSGSQPKGDGDKPLVQSMLDKIGLSSSRASSRSRASRSSRASTEEQPIILIVGGHRPAPTGRAGHPPLPPGRAGPPNGAGGDDADISHPAQETLLATARHAMAAIIATVTRARSTPRGAAVASPAPAAAGPQNVPDGLINIDDLAWSTTVRLGSGTLANTYRGLYQGKHRVAIKVLKKPPVDPFRFKAEARIQASLSHANVLGFKGVVAHKPMTGPPIYAVVYELADMDLRSHLKKAKPNTKAKLTLLVQIANGLQYLHEEKIVHGDVRAANVLMVHHAAKLTDIGSMRMVSNVAHALSYRHTDPNVGLASSPELFRAASNPSSDIYSFALLAWEILAEEEIFDEGAISSVSQLVFYRSLLEEKGPRPNLKELPYDTPPAVRELLKMCWESEQEKRPSIDVVCDVLLEGLRSFSVYRTNTMPDAVTGALGEPSGSSRSSSTSRADGRRARSAGRMR